MEKLTFTILGIATVDGTVTPENQRLALILFFIVVLVSIWIFSKNK